MSILDYQSHAVGGDWSLAAAAAIADEADAATLHFPYRASGYRFDNSVYTGTKRIRFELGASTITLPAGQHGFVLQSNGSSVVGSGRFATVLKHRVPVTSMVLPTLTAALTGTSVSSIAISGGTGMQSHPLLTIANSPSAGLVDRPDAGAVAKVASGTISVVTVPGGSGVSGGTGYLFPPTITIMGGGAAAVVIEGAQGCEVSGFSVDFSSAPGSVGVLHVGGWWCNVHDIDEFYDVATGGSTISATSMGLMSISIDGVAPGPGGAYEANYVCSYRRLHFTRAAVIGHGTSTATTIEFSSCDIKNLALHACVGVTLVNHVCQPTTGTVGVDLLNTSGVTWFGGDLESSGTGLRFTGQTTNFRLVGSQFDGFTGTLFRGQPGTGSVFDFATTLIQDSPVRYGSGGAAGAAFQNAGWLPKGRLGFPFAGNTVVFALNLRMTSATEGRLDDVSMGGKVMLFDTAGNLKVLRASAGANPRTVTLEMTINASGYAFHNLPSTPPVAGSKQLWYDAGAANVVKFVP